MRFAMIEIYNAVTVVFAAATDITPNEKLPGVKQAKELGGGLMTYVLIGAVIAMVLGGLSWAFGSRMNNHGAAAGGKTTIMVAALVAFLVGSAPAWIDYFLNVGEKVN